MVARSWPMNLFKVNVPCNMVQFIFGKYWKHPDNLTGTYLDASLVKRLTKMMKATSIVPEAWAMEEKIRNVLPNDRQ